MSTEYNTLNGQHKLIADTKSKFHNPSIVCDIILVGRAYGKSLILRHAYELVSMSVFPGFCARWWCMHKSQFELMNINRNSYLLWNLFSFIIK